MPNLKLQQRREHFSKRLVQTCDTLRHVGLEKQFSHDMLDMVSKAQTTKVETASEATGLAAGLEALKAGGRCWCPKRVKTRRFLEVFSGFCVTKEVPPLWGMENMGCSLGTDMVL